MNAGSDECDANHPKECLKCLFFFSNKGFKSHAGICTAPSEDILQIRKLHRQHALLEAEADVSALIAYREARQTEFDANKLLMQEHFAVLAAQKRCREENEHGAKPSQGSKGGWWRPSGEGTMACKMCGFVTSTRRYAAMADDVVDGDVGVKRPPVTLSTYLSKKEGGDNDDESEGDDDDYVEEESTEDDEDEDDEDEEEK